MHSFLYHVVEDVLLKFKTLDDVVFILPSNRSIRATKKLLAQKIQVPIFSPKMYSVEQFIQEISGLKPADEIEQQLELYDLYSSLGNDEKDSFTIFWSWSTTVLGDFNEIDRYLIQHEQLYSYLEAIERIKNWNPSNIPTQLIKEYADFSKKVSELYTRYQISFLNKNKGSQGIQYREATKKISEYVNSNAAKSFVIIALNALNEAEKYIFNYILENTDSKIYWDLDTYFVSDPIHEAGYFYRKNHDYFIKHSKKQFLSNSNEYLNKQKISIIGAPKNMAQAQYVGKLLKEIDLDSEPVALVLADETLLPLILNSIPETIKEINISMGYPLLLTQIAKFFNSVLKLRQSEKEQGYPYQQILSFLSVHITKQLLDETKQSDFSKQIRKQNLVHIPNSRLRDLASPTPLSHLFNDSSKPSFLVPALSAIVKKVSVDKNISDIEKAATWQLETFLSDYLTKIEVHPFLDDINSFELLLNDFISKNKVNFKGNPDKGLQIMGLLETRAIDFETVIMTSLNEGILPAGKAVNSFIPYDVKKEFGLPTVKEKDAVYTYHFYRLLQRAKNVYLTYNTEPDVLNGGQPSRFIYQLLADPMLKPNISHGLASPKIRYKSKEIAQIIKSPLLLKELTKKLESGLSPSSLADYIKNPYTFYKKHILNIRDVEDVEENVAYNVLGTIVHDSLESIYKLLPKTSLVEKDFENLLPFVEDHILGHFQGYYEKSSIFQGKNLILFNVIIKYINSVIARDKEVAKNHDFKILSLEESLITFISTKDVTQRFTLKGKLDRMDEVDGYNRIVDYKTGNVNPSGLKIDSIELLFTDPKYSQAFQLLCYVLLKRNNGVSLKEAGILAIKKPNEKLHLISSKKGLENPCSALFIDQFEARLQLLYEEILNPEIPLVDTGE